MKISAEQFHTAQINNEALRSKYPFWHLQGDFFEDEIMILQTSYEGTESTVEKAVMVYNSLIDSVGNPGSLYEHYVNDINYDRTEEYVRYWHGYLILLRPLFALFNYEHIITINALFQLTLTGLFLFILWKRGLKDVIIPYLITYGILMPVITWQTLQYSSCFYVTITGCIALLLLDDKMTQKGNVPYLFLIIGVLLAYFDLLTYPVITLGIPAALWLRLHPSDKPGAKIAGLIKNSFMWGIGYVGMWFGKGLVTAVITRSTGIFGILARNVRFRMSNSTEGGAGESFSISQMLYLNIRRFINSPFVILMLIFLICCFVGLCVKIYRKQFMIRDVLIFIMPFILIALIPFAWYMITVNHSSVHCFYTNKAMVVTVFAVCCGMSCLSSSKHNILDSSIKQTTGLQK